MHQPKINKTPDYCTDNILKMNHLFNHKKYKLKLKSYYTAFTFIFLTITHTHANIVELPNDSLPWLQGKTTQPKQSDNNISANITQNSDDDKTGKTDPRAKADLPPDSPEALLVDEPANKHGFVVDRVLEHNYTPQDYAVLKILDKVTAKTFTVEAKVGNPFKFGWIEVTVKSAKKTPPEEEPEAVAFIDVFAQQPLKKSEHVFSGFIFASSPSISAIEHPRYDIRLFDCLTEEDLKKQAEAEIKKKEEEQKAEEDKKNSKIEKKDSKNKDSKDKNKKDKNTSNKPKNKPSNTKVLNQSNNISTNISVPQNNTTSNHDSD